MRDQSWRIFSSKKLVFQIWWTKALRLSHPTTSQGMCCILHINVVQTLSMHLWEIEWLAFEYFNGYTFYIDICMPSFTVEVYFEFKKGAKKMSKNSCFKILCNRYTYLQGRPSGLDSRGARGGEFRGNNKHVHFFLLICMNSPGRAEKQGCKCPPGTP